MKHLLIVLLTTFGKEHNKQMFGLLEKFCRWKICFELWVVYDNISIPVKSALQFFKKA